MIVPTIIITLSPKPIIVSPNHLGPCVGLAGLLARREALEKLMPGGRHGVGPKGKNQRTLILLPLIASIDR